MATIHTLPLGYVNSFLIQGDPGFILIDSGLPKQENKLWKHLEELEIAPEDIKLIVITHAHQDHTGGLKAVKQRTGAEVLCHKEEAEYLRNGTNPEVVAHTWFLRRLIGLAKEMSIESVEPDILVRDEFPLDDYGIDGKVIHTPGHTTGSLSVIVEGKAAFVGDIAMKLPLISRGSYHPVIGQDLTQVYQSWRNILDTGVETIYTAHGKPFPAVLLEKELKDYLDRLQLNTKSQGS